MLDSKVDYAEIKDIIKNQIKSNVDRNIFYIDNSNWIYCYLRLT